MNTYSNIQEVQQIANKYAIGKVFKSSRKDKKYMVKNPDGKMVHFGAIGYADYTAHKDKERRKRFRTRNHKWALSPKWSSSWLSYNLLWS
jgi:hypothetical protein